MACVCTCVYIIGTLATPSEQGASPPGEVDTVYQVLKQAGEISTTRPQQGNNTVRPNVATELPPARRAQQPPLMLRGATTLTVGPTPHASSSGLTQTLHFIFHINTVLLKNLIFPLSLLY